MSRPGREPPGLASTTAYTRRTPIPMDDSLEESPTAYRPLGPRGSLQPTPVRQDRTPERLNYDLGGPQGGAGGTGHRRAPSTSGTSTTEDIVTGAHVEAVKSRNSSLEQEIARLKKEISVCKENASQYSSKLNEQRTENAQLIQKQNALSSRLLHAQQSERNYEDELFSEKNSHKVTKDALERCKAELREKDSQISQLEMRVLENTRMPVERNAEKTIPEKEMAELRQHYERHCDQMGNFMQNTLENLSRCVDDDAASFAVAQSAVNACASELDGRLIHVERQLSGLRELFAKFSSPEDELTKNLLKLSEENKLIWTRLLKQQDALERTRNDLRVAQQSRGDVSEDGELLARQLQSAETKLKKSQVIIEAQMQREREFEQQMKKTLDDMKVLQSALNAAREERDAMQGTCVEHEKQAEMAASQTRELRRKAEGIEQEKLHLANEVMSLTEQMRNVEQRYHSEHQDTIRNLEAERDAANNKIASLNSDIDSLTQQYERALADFERKLFQYETAHQTWKETRTQLELQHEENIEGLRTLYTQQTQEAAEKINQLSQENYELKKNQGQHHAETMGLQRSLKELQLVNGDLKQQMAAMEESLNRAEARNSELLAELNAVKDANEKMESRTRKAEEEAAALRRRGDQSAAMVEQDKKHLAAQMQGVQKQLAASEKAREKLEEDLKMTQRKLSDDTALKQFRAQKEKEYEALKAENTRIHGLYEQIHRQYADLQTKNSELRQGSVQAQALNEEKELLCRRLAEIPALRQRIDSLTRQNEELQKQCLDARTERDKLGRQLEEMRAAMSSNRRDDAEFDRMWREAHAQVLRLDRQIDEVSTVRMGPSYSMEREQTPPRTQRGGGSRTRRDY